MSNKKNRIDKVGLLLAVLALILGISGFVWSYQTQYHTTMFTVLLPFACIPIFSWLDNPYANKTTPTNDDSTKESRNNTAP